MTPKFPRYRRQFDDRVKRLVDHAKSESPMYSIPAIVNSECRMVTHAYYGGRWWALWYMFKEACYLGTHGAYHSFLLWICDTAGWSKVYDIPQTKDFIAHQQRHGKKCSGSPNCNNMNCIDESIPRWFRTITGWDKI